MNDNKSRDIFYGVVAIATLIVAVIGASLAYFSVTKKSNEGAVGAHSDTVSIIYEESAQVSAQADELIPSSFEVVKEAYETNKVNFEESEDPTNLTNQCLDANNQQVCSIYRFSVKSEGIHTITATLNNEENGFTTGLNFALYDTQEGKWQNLGAGADESATNEDQKIRLNACSNNDTPTENDCFTGDPKEYTSAASKSIFGYDGEGKQKGKVINKNETKTYDLILFLEENGHEQNDDQNKDYKGTIIVDVDGKGAEHITGSMTPTN